MRPKTFRWKEKSACLQILMTSLNLQIWPNLNALGMAYLYWSLKQIYLPLNIVRKSSSIYIGIHISTHISISARLSHLCSAVLLVLHHLLYQLCTLYFKTCTISHVFLPFSSTRSGRDLLNIISAIPVWLVLPWKAVGYSIFFHKIIKLQTQSYTLWRFFFKSIFQTIKLWFITCHFQSIHHV